MPKYIIQSHDYSQTAVISLIVQPDYDALTNVMNFPISLTVAGHPE